MRPSMRSGTLLVLAALLVGHDAEARKKKKNKAPPPPPVGWHADVPVGSPEGGWAHECYYPPDFAKLSEFDRRVKRAEVLDEMLAQWRGERDDGVSFDADRVEEVETVLLGRPEQIETIAVKNLELCKASATHGGDTAAWEAWLKALPGRLTAGECLTPFDYTMFDYLDIFTGWQREVPLCEGDKVHIIATSKDQYQVRKDGPWITAAGDPASPTAGNTDYPCNLEGCLEGMFIARFVTSDGVETILPVGLEMTFTAPENGTLSYRINDPVPDDNKWYKRGTIEDHTAITLEPMQ